MRHKIKGPDRVILLEVGLVVALLFVNWFVNLEYKTDLTKAPSFEKLFIDSPFVYFPEQEQQKQEEKQELKASFVPLNVSGLIKLVDLFKNPEPVLKQNNLPKGPLNFLKSKAAGEQSLKIDSFVESMPQFPGGRSALLRFVQENYSFPQAMFDRDQDVKLMVRFVVHEDGQVTDYEVVSCTVKGVGAEREALNLFEKMPKWIAGEQGGHKVKVRMQIPLNLQLY